jgi:hypothetical protein
LSGNLLKSRQVLKFWQSQKKDKVVYHRNAAQPWVREAPYLLGIKADGGAVSIWEKIKSAKDVEKSKEIVSRVPGVEQVISKTRN